MVVTTGFFDGVHLGHRHILNELVSHAAGRGEESLVVTFWPHPRTVLQQDARDLRLLSSLQEKCGLIRGLGVDRVEVVPFTKEFSRLSTEEYIKDILKGRFGAKAVLLGYDNRMGHNGGSPDDIARIATEAGLEVIRPSSLAYGELPISSTKIREALSGGDVKAASDMLGRPYSLHGVVVAGNRMGRTIGFPTANMKLYEPLKLIPAGGVYSVEVETLGQKYKGMCNIGVRPTIGKNEALTIETNIFDFSEDIYGLDITLRFMERIRSERRFSSMEELKRQLELDKRNIIDSSRGNA